MNFDSYLEPPLPSNGVAYVEANELKTELKLESFAKSAARLSGYDVSIEVESYTDDNDVPRQDASITIRKLPMADGDCELLDVLEDLVAAIQESHRKAALEKCRKAELARAEMEARASR